VRARLLYRVPQLRLLWQRYGWGPTIGAAYAVGDTALALCTASPENLALGVFSNVLAYAPVWLLGCWLVETVSKGQLITGNLTFARLCVVALTVLVGALHYLTAVKLNWSLPLYGALIVPWLWLEVSTGTYPKALENWGRWSYSLYLVHPAAFYGIAPLLIWSGAGRGAHLLVGLGLIFVLSFAFYQLVERPSHRLARELSRNMLRRAPVPAV
jgi:peptidoglycan/LPS O-acetylase OafA/YrhL